MLTQADSCSLFFSLLLTMLSQVVLHSVCSLTMLSQVVAIAVSFVILLLDNMLSLVVQVHV